MCLISRAFFPGPESPRFGVQIVSGNGGSGVGCATGEFICFCPSANKPDFRSETSATVRRIYAFVAGRKFYVFDLAITNQDISITTYKPAGDSSGISVMRGGIIACRSCRETVVAADVGIVDFTFVYLSSVVKISRDAAYRAGIYMKLGKIDITGENVADAVFFVADISRDSAYISRSDAGKEINGAT